MASTRVGERARAARWSVGLAAVLVLSACGGGDDGGLELEGQKVNGVDDAAATAKEALSDYAAATGAGVEKAECHLRIVEYGLGEDDSTKVPESVDCLPVGFLGDSGFNAVSFPVMTVPDAQRPKELQLEVLAAGATANRFDAASAEFTPGLPDELPEPSAATVPAGMVQIGNLLVNEADLATFKSRALQTIESDNRYAAEDKFTMGSDPKCLFDPSLTEIWCGPGVSLTLPEGKVGWMRGSVPYIDLTTYQGREGSGDGDESAVYVDGDVVWQEVGSEPGKLIDAAGQPATLPAVDSIEAPELPTIEAGFFADVTDAETNYGCLDTGRAAGLCDDMGTKRFETEPSVLLDAPGWFELTKLGFAQQTGTADRYDIVDAERAADGEQLVALTGNVKRVDGVPDTTELKVSILVNDTEMGGWEGYTGERSFFMSVPTNATIRVRLESEGEVQDLVIKDRKVTRETERPEWYEEIREYGFSGDQQATNDADETVRVEVDALHDPNWQVRYIVVDGAVKKPAPGKLFLALEVKFRYVNFQELKDCSLELVLADGTVVAPSPLRGAPCVQNGFVGVYFEIPANADIKELKVNQMVYDDGTFSDVTIPWVAT